MGEVIAYLAMSLDGFIADPDDGCDELFGFYQSGDVSVKLSEGFPELHVSQATADLLTRSVAKAGATVVGRRLATDRYRCPPESWWTTMRSSRGPARTLSAAS